MSIRDRSVLRGVPAHRQRRASAVLSRSHAAAHLRCHQPAAPSRRPLLGTIQQTGPFAERRGGAIRARAAQEPGGGFRGAAAVDPRRLPQGIRRQDLLRLQGAGSPDRCALLALCPAGAREAPFFVYAAALGVGFLVPDFWLGRQISTRQKRIRRGLPDVLDLLVICIEAGLSLDQATARTARGAAQRAARPVRRTEHRGARAARRPAARRCLEAPCPSAPTWTACATGFHARAVGTTGHQHRQDFTRPFRYPRTQRVQASRGASGQDLRQAGLSAGVFHFSVSVPGTLGPAVIIMMDSFKLLTQ